MPLGASRLSFLAKTAEVAAVEQRTATDVNNLGDAVLTTSQYKFGGSSIRFDGDASSDQRVVSPAATGIGTGDYTIECWIRLDELNALHAITYIGDIAHYIHQDGKIAYYHDTGTLGTNVSISTNTWHHVAWSRESGTVRMFVDGNLEGTITGETDALPSNDLTIGCKSANGQDMRGYLDEYRFSNTALYTASFTAPTAPFVNNNSTTKLLIHADGTNGDAVLFDDNGDRKPYGIESAGATITTSDSKFGNSSIDLTGSAGGNIGIEDPDTNLVQWYGGDYTLECFVKIDDLTKASVDTSGVSPSTLFGNHPWPTGSSYWNFGPRKNGSIGLYYYNGSLNEVNSSASIVTTGTWYHIALCHTASTGAIEIFLDGSRVANATVSGTPQSNVGSDFAIGAYNNVIFDGKVDEIRVSNSVRYSGTSYTVPTAAFENDANTLLLLHAEEGLNGTTEIFDDNGHTNVLPAIAIGTGEYAVDNNGTGERTYSSLYENTSATTTTVSLWFKINTNLSGFRPLYEEFYNDASYGVVSRIIFDAGYIYAEAYDGFSRKWMAGYNNANCSLTTLTDGNWHHVIFSFDSQNYSTNPPKMYLDGTLISNFTTPSANWNMKISSGQNSGGFLSRGSGSIPDVSISDFWFDDSYIDLTSSTNREKFRTSSGLPADLGTDGSTPTGSQPMNFWSPTPSGLGDNLGSNTNTYTENGTFTAISGPGA
jgi:hypothetical protein